MHHHSRVKASHGRVWLAERKLQQQSGPAVSRWLSATRGEWIANDTIGREWSAAEEATNRPRAALFAAAAKITVPTFTASLVGMGAAAPSTRKATTRKEISEMQSGNTGIVRGDVSEAARRLGVGRGDDLRANKARRWE